MGRISTKLVVERPNGLVGLAPATLQRPAIHIEAIQLDNGKSSSFVGVVGDKGTTLLREQLEVDDIAEIL